MLILAATAIIGLTMLIAASVIGSKIVKSVRDKFEVDHPGEYKGVSNFIDYAKMTKYYIEKTGDQYSVKISYLLSTIGGIIFVFSIILILYSLQIPK